MGAVSQEYFASIGYDTNKLKPGELPPWMDGVDRTDQPTYANQYDKTPYWSSTPEGMDPQDPNAVQWSPYAPGTQTPQPPPPQNPGQNYGGGGGNAVQPATVQQPAGQPPTGPALTGKNHPNRAGTRPRNAPPSGW